MWGYELTLARQRAHADPVRASLLQTALDTADGVHRDKPLYKVRDTVYKTRHPEIRDVRLKSSHWCSSARYTDGTKGINVLEVHRPTVPLGNRNQTPLILSESVCLSSSMILQAIDDAESHSLKGANEFHEGSTDVWRDCGNVEQHALVMRPYVSSVCVVVYVSRYWIVGLSDQADKRCISCVLLSASLNAKMVCSLTDRSTFACFNLRVHSSVDNLGRISSMWNSFRECSNRSEDQRVMPFAISSVMSNEVCRRSIAKRQHFGNLNKYAVDSSASRGLSSYALHRADFVFTRCVLRYKQRPGAFLHDGGEKLGLRSVAACRQVQHLIKSIWNSTCRVGGSPEEKSDISFPSKGIYGNVSSQSTVGKCDLCLLFLIRAECDAALETKPIVYIDSVTVCPQSRIAHERLGLPHVYDHIEASRMVDVEKRKNSISCDLSVVAGVEFAVTLLQVRYNLELCTCRCGCYLLSAHSSRSVDVTTSDSLFGTLGGGGRVRWFRSLQTLVSSLVGLSVLLTSWLHVTSYCTATVLRDLWWWKGYTRITYQLVCASKLGRGSSLEGEWRCPRAEHSVTSLRIACRGLYLCDFVAKFERSRSLVGTSWVQDYNDTCMKSRRLERSRLSCVFIFIADSIPHSTCCPEFGSFLDRSTLSERSQFDYRVADCSIKEMLYSV
ncbi:hypothetical protein Tco_1555768 [Tanacetum coccineum]